MFLQLETTEAQCHASIKGIVLKHTDAHTTGSISLYGPPKTGKVGKLL